MARACQHKTPSLSGRVGFVSCRDSTDGDRRQPERIGTYGCLYQALSLGLQSGVDCLEILLGAERLNPQKEANDESEDAAESGHVGSDDQPPPLGSDDTQDCDQEGDEDEDGIDNSRCIHLSTGVRWPRAVGGRQGHALQPSRSWEEFVGGWQRTSVAYM